MWKNKISCPWNILSLLTNPDPVFRVCPSATTKHQLQPPSLLGKPPVDPTNHPILPFPSCLIAVSKSPPGSVPLPQQVTLARRPDRRTLDLPHSLLLKIQFLGSPLAQNQNTLVSLSLPLSILPVDPSDHLPPTYPSPSLQHQQEFCQEHTN